MSAAEIKVPDIGDFAGVPVIDILVKAGDTVEVDTPLITLETEKATLDVPSTIAGRIIAVKVSKGAKVSQGDVIATVEAADAQAASAPAPAAAPAPTPAAAPSPAPASARNPSSESDDTQVPTVREQALSPSKEASAHDTNKLKQLTPSAPSAVAAPSAEPEGDKTVSHAGPSVRKFARELGVNLAQVRGSGIKDRITHDDVKAFVKKTFAGSGAGAAGTPAAALPKVAVVDFAKFGAVETRPLNRIQRISGARLHASWVNLPHVTQFDRADITDLEDTRVKLKAKASQQGIKLTPLAFVIRACVKTLKEFPQFNVSLDAAGENLIHKKYLHVGFAADTPNGLVVPVIRDADRKDVYELARELGDLSAKARAGKLTATEMQGGCFTISSLGSIGGTAFTPIINAPEVAILGVSRAEHQPIYKEGGFVPRLMLPLSLSYDHRVIDGALGVRFTTFLAQQLADVRGLLEAIP